MKKTKYIILFTMCMFAFPLVSNAECSYERRAELSRMAGNVKFSYNYEINNNTASFTINATNITNDIYVKDYTNDTIATSPEGIFKHDFDGVTIRYDIYSNDENCQGEKILTKYVNLPSYNSFSNNEACKAYPDFKYCQLWQNTDDISKEDIKTELSEYVKKNETTTTETEINSWGKIKQFINNNKVLLIIAIICLIGLPILAYLKRRRM